MHSTVWTVQRCSWSYTEKRRGKKEIELAKRIKGRNEKERDRSSQSSFPLVSSTVWNTQRFIELGREEKGEGGDRGDLVERKESPKGERAVKPVILLPSKNRY